MHTKVFACLLLSILIGTSLSRSMSASHQGKAVREANELPRMPLVRIGRQVDNLSEAQKAFINQYMSGIYGGVKKKEEVEDDWFGLRRILKDFMHKVINYTREVLARSPDKDAQI